MKMVFVYGKCLSSKQWLLTIVVIVGTATLVYIQVETEIAKLDQARIKLEHALYSLQQNKPLEYSGNAAPSESMFKSSYGFKRALPYNPGQFPVDSSVIIYNRIPKTGSTSLMGIAYDLCAKNEFHVLHINTTKNLHHLSLSDQVRFVYNVTQWTAMKPAVYHGHIAFLDFSKFGVPLKPIFINVIRQPLDRLVSYYYFLRYGDDFRPNLIRKKQGDKMTFDECVALQESDCAPENMWIQIPFFCGHGAQCWEPGNEWALEQAKRNLMQHYLLVGVTEELVDFVAILEASLPHFFHGALDLFTNGKKSHLRRTANKIEPSQETLAKVKDSKVWKMENEFYEFALEHFRFVKKKTLQQKNGVLSDRGQQFTYEKIRPKR